MARFVIDAPTLLHLVANEVAIDPAHRLVAPTVIRSQALALLYSEVRAGRLAESEALRRHDLCTGLKMRLLGDRVSRGTAWRIAREQGWEDIYDAEYCAVTRLQADALVTVDRDFGARVKSVVPVAPLESLTV